MKTFAFDIGGTNMRMAELTATGIGPVARILTPKQPDDAIERLAMLALPAAHGEGIERAIVALAAIVNEEGSVITATNLPAWNGFPFARALSHALHANVEVVNDAELAALGEAQLGAARDFADVAYLTIGTGVGTAHVVDGIVEPHSSEGEARAIIIKLPRGRSLETQIGGKALEAKHGVPAEHLPQSVWTELTPCLAHGVLAAARLWHPDIVVLGGSLMNDENGFRAEDVAEAARALAKEGEVLPQVAHAAFPDSSALEGARALVESRPDMP